MIREALRKVICIELVIDRVRLLGYMFPTNLSPASWVCSHQERLGRE